MDGAAQAPPAGDDSVSGVLKHDGYFEPAALPLDAAEQVCWPETFSVDSFPSLEGSLGALPSMSMSFDSGDMAAAASLTSTISQAVGDSSPKHRRAAPVGVNPNGCAALRCDEPLPGTVCALPPDLSAYQPTSVPVQVHQTPTATATPVSPEAAARATAFMTHCQLAASEYPQSTAAVSVPTGQQLHEQMCAIREHIELQARSSADAKQLRGGSQAATKQLEMQLDLVMRDYSARLNQYLLGYSDAVAQQKLLLQERTALLGAEAHNHRCRVRVAAAETYVQAKLATLAQECLKTIDGALQAYRRDSMQLLAKYNEQQKKKQKLPDSAVAILNGWMTENFANPYPTRAQKLVLVQATGLEMKQINQWFINARVRIWKPAVQLMMDDKNLS